MTPSLPDSLSLAGKRALVTGGSRGIGAAIVKMLAERGASVVFTWATSAARADEVVAAVEARGGKAVALQADGTDRAAMATLVDRAVDALGGLDILVNNAGTVAGAGLTEITDEQFDQLFELNVRAPFVLARAAARVMTDGGRIINIGSVNGDIALFPGVSLYAMTKSALQGLTRGWARDLAGRGITVNNVQPGPIDTDLNPADGPIAAMLAPLTARGRYGTAEDVAELVAFVASPASANITGQMLDTGGGIGI
ncbi:MAG: SDR family oxidoreductase [Pseudomonadales bacterium]|jgi:3-oxoacyl-[acyl-carrier protein] reductase|nr:SDR family oxidoreductase [Pseudomonadales bacterium]